MRYRLGNAQHIGAREEQQDAFGFSDVADREYIAHAGILGVLADGMGGMAHGGEVAHTAVRAFLDSYRGKSNTESILDALERSLFDARDAVSLFCREAGVEGQAGSTFVAAVLHDETLQWVSVGDSRVYLVRDGGLIQITTDHVYARDLDRGSRSGEITAEQAMSDPDREALTSYLGLDELPLVDSSARPLPLQPHDQILLCSDGLYRTLNDAQIARAMTGDIEAACAELVHQVMLRRLAHQDNVTVLGFACEAAQPRTGLARWFRRRRVTAAW